MSVLDGILDMYYIASGYAGPDNVKLMKRNGTRLFYLLVKGDRFKNLKAALESRLFVENYVLDPDNILEDDEFIVDSIDESEFIDFSKVALLDSLFGMLSDLSPEEIKDFDEAVKRRALFEKERN